MNCRTHKKRIEIVNNYTLKYVEHNIILHNRKIRSDANDILTNEYCKFLVMKNDIVIDTITCGEKVANDFCKLLNIKPICLFNIFSSIVKTNYKAKDNIGNGEKEIFNNKWNEENKLLYNAFKILTISYNLKPKTPIYNIIDDIENNTEYFDIKKLKSFNTIILSFNITLKDLLLKIEKENKKKLKQFNFEKLKKIFIENYPNEKQNFD